jgi:hypothetical protein
MDIYIIAQCFNRADGRNIERNRYLFKINGHFFGHYIKKANLLSKHGLDLGDDYLLCIEVKSIEAQNLYGVILSAKKLSTIKRDFL